MEEKNIFYKKKYEYLKSFINNEKIPNAFLFYGEKNNPSLELIFDFLKTLNCPNGDTFCDKCHQCKMLNQLTHPDVKIVFPEVSTTSKDQNEDNFKSFCKLFLKNKRLNIDDWRKEIKSGNKQLFISKEIINKIIEFMNIPPVVSKYHVTIIWLAEFLNINAANSLLKILEEPKLNSLFFLTTEDLNKILPTIQSRAVKVSVNIEENNILGNEYFDQFMSLMRMSFSLDFEKLIPFIDVFAEMDKENIKAFFEYCTKLFEILLKFVIKIDENIGLDVEKQEQLLKFSKFLDLEKINILLKEFSECNYKISRNANIKLLFLNLAIEINKIIKSN